jgi:hypothetical protein
VYGISSGLEPGNYSAAVFNYIDILYTIARIIAAAVRVVFYEHYLYVAKVQNLCFLSRN